MTKKELFQILSAANKEEVLALGALVTEKYPVEVIRPAQKTLVMVKMREPVGGSLFYLGELLCVECMAEVNGSKGFALLAGDDFAKAEAAAAIDAACNARIPESEGIWRGVEALRERQRAARALVNAQVMASKVNFAVMGE